MPVDADLIIVYEQWQNTDKVHIKLTAGDAYKELHRQLKGFLLHVYVN